MKYLKISMNWINIIYVVCSLIMVISGIIGVFMGNVNNERLSLLGVILIGIGAWYLFRPLRLHDSNKPRKKKKDREHKKLKKWTLILMAVIVSIPIVNLIFDLAILNSNLNNFLVLFLMIMVNIASGIFIATIVIGLIVLILISKSKKLQEGIVSLYANNKKNR